MKYGVARGAEIVFQIRVHRRDTRVSTGSREGWIRSRNFGRDFRLVRQKDRIGMWDYRLEVRAK